jgi:hypothetical protein
VNRRVITPALPRVPTYSPSVGAGRYFFPVNTATSATSATVGVGTLRLTAWLNPVDITIDRIGGEVTVVGDVGSKVRIGIYSDNGFAYPGALFLDAGQLAGDSATTQDITLSNTFIPAGLYWLGGTVQSVTTTQPTVRTISTYHPPVTILGSTSTPTTGSAWMAYSMSSVTGAFPGTFSSTVSTGSVCPRLHMRLV